jgi:hypothetical protein
MKPKLQSQNLLRQAIKTQPAAYIFSKQVEAGFIRLASMARNEKSLLPAVEFRMESLSMFKRQA